LVVIIMRPPAALAAQHRIEILRLEIAGGIAGRVGIGDVLRQQILALMQPGHAFAQHGKQRCLGQVHRGNLLLALFFTPTLGPSYLSAP
jgi:hypothetical protein